MTRSCLLLLYLCITCWIGLFVAQDTFPTLRPTRTRRPTQGPTLAPTILPYSIHFSASYAIELRNTNNVATAVITSTAQNVEVLGILSNAACQSMAINNQYCNCDVNCLKIDSVATPTAAIAAMLVSKTFLRTSDTIIHTEAINDKYTLTSNIAVEVFSQSFPIYSNNPQGLYNFLKTTWDAQIVTQSKTLISSLKAYDNQLFANISVTSTSIGILATEYYGLPSFSPTRGPQDDDAVLAGTIAGCVIGGLILIGACIGIAFWYRYMRIKYKATELTKELATQIATKPVNTNELLVLGAEIKDLQRKESVKKMKSLTNSSFYRMPSKENLEIVIDEEEEEDVQQDFGLEKLERIKSLVQDARVRALVKKESMTPITRRKSVRFDADMPSTVRTDGSDDEYDGKLIMGADGSPFSFSPERLDMLLNSGRKSNTPKGKGKNSPVKNNASDSELESKMSSVTGDESDRSGKRSKVNNSRASFYEKYNANVIHGGESYMTTPNTGRSDVSESSGLSKRVSFMQERVRYMDNGSSANSNSSVSGLSESGASTTRGKKPTRSSMKGSRQNSGSLSSADNSSAEESMVNPSTPKVNTPGDTHDALYKGSSDRVVMTTDPNLSSMMNGLRKLGQNKDFRASFYEKYNFQKVSASDTDTVQMDRKKSVDNKDFQSMIEAKEVLAMTSRSFDDLDFETLGLKKKLGRKVSMERFFVNNNNTSDLQLDKYSKLAIQSSLSVGKDLIKNANANKTPRKTPSKKSVSETSPMTRRVSFSATKEEDPTTEVKPEVAAESLLLNIRLSKTPSFHEDPEALSELTNTTLWHEEDLSGEVSENLIGMIDDEYRVIGDLNYQEEHPNKYTEDDQVRTKHQERVFKYKESLKASAQPVADTENNGQPPVGRIALTMEEVMMQLISMEGGDSAIFALPENFTLS